MSELTEHLRHIGCLNKPRCIESADLLDAQATELARLREQLEVERIRLAACGVVAMANTPESAAKNRQMKDEYRSGSLDDVIRIVDSEMALREQVVAQQARIAQMREALELVKRDAPHNIPYYAFGDNEAACEMSRKLENIEGYGDQVLSTPDDLSALKQHEDKVWNEAVEKCAQVSAFDMTREAIRSLKR